MFGTPNVTLLYQIQASDPRGRHSHLGDVSPEAQEAQNQAR